VIGLPLFSAPAVPMAAPVSDLASAARWKLNIKATAVAKAISVRLILIGSFSLPDKLLRHLNTRLSMWLHTKVA